MPYTKTGPFTDNSASPPISAAFLNSLENGVAAANAVSIAPAPSGGDDTAALNAWLTAAAGTCAAFRPAAYKTIATLTIPASTTVLGYGASITGQSGAADMVTMSGNGARLSGLEINGNAAVKTGGNGVTVTGAARVSVEHCYIHDVDGKGISVASGSTAYRIADNTILNAAGQGINVDSSSQGRIRGNHIDTALHGIQWWGGDSSLSTTIGITHLSITGNVVRNVHGGIWGSLGQYIEVTGNDIDTCSDVGIDFEGCLDGTATGNTVRAAANAGLSVFYGSSRIVFANNAVDNSSITASNGQGFHAYTTTTNTRISVIGNTFTTYSQAVINDSGGSLADSVIAGNETRSSGTNAGILLRDGNRIHILNNVLHVVGPTGIDFQGISDGRVEGNEVFTDSDSSSVGAVSAGIHLYWRSATYPGKRVRCRNNTVVGFVQAIFDDCGGDNASYCLIENNVATPVNHKGTTGYTGVINNNRKDTDHTAAVVAAV